MYCKYWNLQKAPFDNIPDPSMYTDCHTSMEQVIAETIFAIKEANDAFAVIIGASGSGKTLSLRIIMDSLEPDKFNVVIVTNPEVPFSQLLKEIIWQLSTTSCEENRKSVLLETFRRLL
jgi:type II secretory pathway predicted ATPase ExeA